MHRAVAPTCVAPDAARDRADGQAALPLVRAWAAEGRWVLEPVAVDDKANEITAIPLPLRLLALEGAAVIIDALGGQTAGAAQIGGQGGDEALARKGTHPAVPEAVRRPFAEARADGFAA